MGKKRHYSTNKHHLMPKSRGWKDNINNIKRLKVNFHNALHIIFNNDTPTEQLLDLLDLNSQILKDRFKEELFDVIKAKRVEDIYKNWIIKRWIIVPKHF